MFGLSAFAQSPFASLGGQSYVLTLTENATLADTPTTTFVFPFAVTEPFTSSDTNAEIDVFYEGVVEALTQADASTQQSNYLEAQTESLTSAETESITAQDRKSTRLNSSHIPLSRMPSSA